MSASDQSGHDLELSGGRIHSMKPDGSDRKVVVSNCRLPDGIAVDVSAGHIYWTNMGVPSANDGSVERADFDGKNRKIIVPEGRTYTPKQLHLDSKKRQALLVRSRRDASYALEPRRLAYRNARGERSW